MQKVYEHHAHFPRELWRWKDFSPAEIACRGDQKLLVDEEAMDKLQALRDRLGVPLIVNSAYRSPEYNAKIGGAKASEHLKGRAFDISMANHDPAVFEAAARRVGFTGFGFYKKNNFIHIDIGKPRQWGDRWFTPVDISVYAPQDNRFSPEAPLQPETAAQDRDLVGGVLGAGGASAAAGAVVKGIGGLDPAVQMVAVVGLFVALAAALYVVRNRIKRLAR